MSLVPKSPSEILQEYGAELNTLIGPNVLQDPVANRSSNLVRILSLAALSLNDIQQKVEAQIVEQNPDNLEGIALTNYAAARGVTRKVGTKSIAILIVTGQQGAILPNGSQLTDRFGSIWETREDIILESPGLGCAFAQGLVYSVDSGTFTLVEDELVYDNTPTPSIFTATNGMMIQVGGSLESDESLRNRLKGRGPLVNIQGTADNTLAAIWAVDGVTLARFAFVDNCAGKGPMFIVKGGDPQEVCSALLQKAGLTGELVGNTSCEDLTCSQVRYQEACPFVLAVEVTLSCDCPAISEDIIKSLIMSQAPAVARIDTINSNDITTLHPDIDSVRFRIIRPLIYSSPTLSDAPEIFDPLTNQLIVFATDEMFGVCAGERHCVDNTREYMTTLKLNPWEYAIIVEDEITFTGNCPEPEDICVPCDQ